MTFPLPGGRSLVLAGSGRAGLWLLAGAVALGLILVLYREERRLVSRRAGLALVSLRALAVLALVAALFEPTSAWTERNQARGRVVVAVDASASMDQTDPGRPEVDARRLAQTLGLPANEPATPLTRREVARRLLDGDGSPVGRLRDRSDLRAASFARGVLASGPLAEVAGSLRAPARADDPARLATDWTAALRQGLDGTETTPVVAVVLLSDGRANAGGKAGGDPAAALLARGVPVFPILVGSVEKPRDVAIAAVRAPDSVQKGDQGSIGVTVKADGLAPGTEVGVTLSRPGAEPIRRTVRAPGDGSRPTVSFPVPFDAAGVVPLTVEADLATPDDARPDNNRRAVAVRVADDPTRVLLVDGEARWEYRYLRDTLARDPRLRVDRVVFRPPTDSDTDPADPTRWPEPEPGRDAGADPLAKYDLIVLGDFDPADIPPEVWSRLDRFVAARGGTLAIVPGPRSLAAWAGQTQARALAPLVDPAVLPDPGAEAGADPARPVLATGSTLVPSPAALADADGWPMLQLGDDPAGSGHAWSRLPRMPWVAGGRPKPAATALALAGGTDRPDAAIAAQPYGLGKVLWVGTNATWRWRFRVGDPIHGRFWGQVVRWAGSAGLAVGNTAIRHGPARARVPAGDPVVVRARVAEDLPDKPAAPLLAARVVPRDAPPGAPGLALVPLRPAPGRPGLFEAEVPDLPPGSYAVRLDAPDFAGAGPIPDAPVEVVAAETGETVELAADPAPLERLARATGGRVLRDFEADGLAALVQAQVRTVTRTVERPLWDNPVALGLFLALMSAEWILRKKVGLR